MKVYILILICIITQTFACSTQQSANSHTQSDQVVLEIITTAKGMVYPKEGDLLDMRLYKSGRFEYDDYPDINPPKVTSENASITRKEAKLAPEQVKELISLAEQPDFISAKEEYPSLYYRVDDEWITTIKFTYQGREKKVIAVNFTDVVYNQERRRFYPPSVVKLFVRAEELKSKVTGEASKYRSPTEMNYD